MVFGRLPLGHLGCLLIAGGVALWMHGPACRGADALSAEVVDRVVIPESLAGADDRPITAESPQDPHTVTPASLQPQPIIRPRQEAAPTVAAPQAARQVSANLFGEVGQSLLSLQRRAGASPHVDIVFGLEAGTRVTTDAGSLLGKSPSILGVGVQRRTPIVTDPRIRGSRVGQLAASGSYWLPARIDLDTILSKIDSRIIDDITVIKGPYSARYGPGFDFVDVQMLPSPRFENGFESHGSTSVDYQVNGEQWYGRQNLWGGDSDWGFRAGYGHRTGNDYVSGDGTGIPSSYKSRDIDFALGADLTCNSSLEFNALRLDQTDVEYPGQAFDMDYLVTDGYDLEYVLEDTPYFDRLVVSGWYNRTRFAGNAQAPGKRNMFPYFRLIRFEGFTDADLRSAGYSAAVTRGEDGGPQVTVGVDLRHVNQELNEISSGRINTNVFSDVNSPIPKSRSTNPGIFLEHVRPLSERLQVTCGARVDWVAANVIDDPAKLSQVSTQPNLSLADVLGSDRFAQSFTPWSVYVTGAYELCPHWNLTAAAGRAVRPPSLTELYACETYLFLLQSGQNIVVGDPELRSERLWQLDLGTSCQYDRFRAGVNGFYAWINDYITFENIFERNGPGPVLEQVMLKYVNTDLATLAGFEVYAEYDANAWLTPFATLKYVEGRDLTRDGDFATRRALNGQPSVKVPGRPRGDFSVGGGEAAEPLPGILPLESRIGFRLHQVCPQPSWGMEISARIVADQNRIATSLRETRTPGFTVFDLRGFWRPSERLLCVAGVENFSDVNYREHLDFRSQNGNSVLQPGINFYFGSELTY